MEKKKGSESLGFANDVHTYPPVGRCIYCGTTEGKLSKEHIVPFALNGRMVLPEASCGECAKKTQKNEEICFGEHAGMFYPLRARFKMRSRRKWADRRTVTTGVLKPDGTVDKRTFGVDGLPVAVVGLELPIAGIITGEAPTKMFNGAIVLRVNQPEGEFVPPADGMMRVVSVNHTALLHLIAKIAYSFAAAETGLDGLLPSLADVILWKSEHPTHLIGGGSPADRFQRVHEETDYLYLLRNYEFDANGSHFGIVMVHLFGQLGMPKYHVVVRHRPSNQ